MPSQYFTHATAPKVCIVGAGVAGLRCADVLIRSGFEVTILEARNRIGGRVWTTDYFGLPVDLGCSQIPRRQGMDNPLVEIAAQTNTDALPMQELASIVLKDGTLLTGSEASVLKQDTSRIIDDAVAFSLANHQAIPPDARFFDWFRAKVQALNSSDVHKERMLQVIDHWGSRIGAAADTLSLQNMWMAIGPPTDYLLIPQTYEKILGSVARAAKQDADLRLKHEVILIQSPPEGFSRGSGIVVKTSNGHDFVFDHVVVTAPLGWLKRNGHVFEPPMPASLQSAVESMGYGMLEKIFIQFPSAWWNNGTDDYNLITQPIFFASPEDTPQASIRPWGLEAIAYAAFPHRFGQPTLVFHTYGEISSRVNALAVISNQSPAEYLRCIRSYFEPFYCKLPGFRPCDYQCTPVGVHGTSWRLDPWAGFGSHTYFPWGMGDGETIAATVRQGMKERQIWFGGEHCGIGNTIGTIAGAYQSGTDTAMAIRARHL